MKSNFFLLLSALLVSNFLFGQQTFRHKINWEKNKTEQVSLTEKITLLNFEGAQFDANLFPLFTDIQDLPGGASTLSVELSETVYESFLDSDLEFIKNLDKLSDEPKLEYSLEFQQKKPKAVITLMPLRKNKLNGRVEKLISFSLLIFSSNTSQSRSLPFNYASNSVLSTGDWYKIGVTADGIYKLNFSFLKQIGIAVDSINPKNIRLYGNGGKMLSYSNSAFRYDDLQENAIEVIGENDNRFDTTDYVLFYGEGTTTWNFTASDQKFHHQLHLYSDTNYYFLTIQPNGGKRISFQSSELAAATNTVTTFDDYAFHEQESVNFIKTGRNWYGENFGIVNDYTFNFNFPNVDLSQNAYLKADVMAQSSPSASFTVSCQNTSINLTPPPINPSCYYCDYALAASGTSIFQPNSANFNIDVNFSKPGGGIASSGWLNYLELNVRRSLSMTGTQFSFRDIQSVGPGKIADFTVTNLSNNQKLWDVTDPINIKQQELTFSGSSASFRLSTDVLREFIAFDNSSALSPFSFGKVENQNLHSFYGADMVIVSYPSFMNEASRLADFHRMHDSLSVIVVSPQQIYNEFSSGMQDITAIKHFVKMLYDKATNTSDMPRYLLLFGDGSYDNKTRNITTNTNFIPTYQSDNSTDPTKSYVTDDYYALLDDTEGDGLAQLMDVGVGRFPAKSVAEAQAMVNKIINYATKTPLVYESSNSCSNEGNSDNGDWKNIVCFVADDQDGNTHISDAETISTYVDTNYRNINVDKIYFDAYKQISTAGGERYPDVTTAINQRVESGALILNYTGHGGETGWAHERVIDISTINSWNNTKKLPLFVTATCEFSRYDDPARTSAGEDVLLNPNGGGVGLLTTTRLVYSNPNFVLNYNFYKNAFKTINGEMPRLGDITKVTKNASVSSASTNHRNFTLLGDPALRLDYPEYSVITTTLNAQAISVTADTMKALNRMTVSGFIQDKSGNKITNFNGLIYPTVFDKPKIVTTQANDSDSPKKSFALQKSIVYKGKVSVVNGDFSFSFIVPKDIAFNFGKGRLSYYADNGVTDASGFNENFIIGGVTDRPQTDNEGPQVQLYLNSDKFVDGGMTNNNPILFAKVSDENGINTVGNGIGHDIISVVDESSDKTFILNDFYQSDLDSYQKGTVRYQLSDLSEGTHRLSFKVWDVYNNSSLVYTDFFVSKSDKLAMSRVFNYPNPFTTSTDFYFQHNQCCNGLNVQVQIFTVSGKLIKTIEQFVRTEGFLSESIHWDGLDDYGDKIGKGVYIYRLKAIDSNGNKANMIEKLVVLN